jgi:hypothetical protein
VDGRGAPHEAQKRVPAMQGLPQALQKKPALGADGGAFAVPGCGGTAVACRCGSAESAQISATIQPMNVQPARRSSNSMAVKLDLFRARYAGRKYRNSETRRKMGWK